MNTSLKRAWLLLAVLFFGALALGGCAPYEFKGAELTPPKPLNDFALPATTGDMFQLSDYEGQIVLLYFGYTFCPDICPATMFQVKQAMEQLGDDADEVQVVMITVDPERDTLDQLERYLTNFNKTFIGLRTTDLEQLDAILSDFGAYYEIEDVSDSSSAGYLVSHTASLFLVDRDMSLREIFIFGSTADDIASDIRHILREN